MEIARGEITKTVYSLLRDDKFDEAIGILEQLLQLQSNSRSVLSLLGYCYFHLNNFERCVIYYDRLCTLCPDIPEYQYHLSLSLYHAGSLEEALETSYLKADPSPDLQDKVIRLQSAIQYCRDETGDSKSLLEKCSVADQDVEMGKGCLAYKEGNYTEAIGHFENAAKFIGMEPLLWYNRAVSFYRIGDFPSAAFYIGDIVQHGAINYPELRMGHKLEDPNIVATVENSRALRDSALVEALNLKAALEYELHKGNAARETLLDLPPRSETDIDPITLHNHAILNVKHDSVESFRKLRYLLEQQAFPPETFLNLMILYWRYEQFDMMADLLAVYDEYKTKFLDHDMKIFFESLINHEVSPEEASMEIEKQCKALGKALITMVQKVANVKVRGREDEIRQVCNDFEDLVDGKFMPMLLTLGKIYWDKDDLEKVEEILRVGAEFLDDRDPWLINCAHVVYRRGRNFAEAAALYEMVVSKHQTELLEISAVCLANLIVCYVSICRNEEAERIIQQLEVQEMQVEGDQVKTFHSCILSLVIGTFYCVKNDFQFGMARIHKSLMDFDSSRLGPDTWFHAKSCILSLIERIVKNNLAVEEETLDETLELLKGCEEHGKSITTVIEEKRGEHEGDKEDSFIPMSYGTKTIAFEARYLQYLLKCARESALV